MATLQLSCRGQGDKPSQNKRKSQVSTWQGWKAHTTHGKLRRRLCAYQGHSHSLCLFWKLRAPGDGVRMCRGVVVSVVVASRTGQVWGYPDDWCRRSAKENN